MVRHWAGSRFNSSRLGTQVAHQTGLSRSRLVHNARRWSASHLCVCLAPLQAHRFGCSNTRKRQLNLQGRQRTQILRLLSDVCSTSGSADFSSYLLLSDSTQALLICAGGTRRLLAGGFFFPLGRSFFWPVRSLACFSAASSCLLLAQLSFLSTFLCRLTHCCALQFMSLSVLAYAVPKAAGNSYRKRRDLQRSS